jgi:hypothetical protein
MGLAIFDKDAPVLDGLTQTFTRAQASIGGLADAVGSNELRHAPPTVMRGVASKTTALAGTYQGRGGNEVWIVRNQAATNYFVMRGNADGSVTTLNTISDGPALTGGFRTLNAAMGTAATDEGFTDAEVSGNYAVGAIAASSYAYGILRIYCEVAKFNGSAWQVAQYAMFYSTDNGSTWAFEYRTPDDDIGTSRGRNWCLNLWPTPIYNRTGDPLILIYADADYFSKAGSPTTGRFTASVFARSSVSNPFIHLGSIELGVIEDVDHGHAACAVECDFDGFDSVQVVIACGDGADNNVMRRWIYETSANINPSSPNTLTGFFDAVNWTLDANWKHGIAPAGTRGTPGNQVTYMMAGQNEGELLGLYDNEAGIFGRFTPGGESATAGRWETLGPKHPGGGNISLYGSTDGSGKIAMCMWDDSGRGSNGTMADVSASISRSPGIARIMYSADWGNTWTEVARPDNTDSQMMIAAGRLFWTEGSSAIFTKRLPSLRPIRPASVSPGGTGIFVNHNVTDPLGNLQNWLATTPSAPHTYTLIQKSGGVFTDPDTSEVIPHPPCITNTMMKVNVSASGGQTIGRVQWGRRHSGAGETIGQVDTRFWIMPASNSEGARVGCTGRAHSGGGVSGFFLGGGPRTYGTYHGRESWYPVYDAGDGWPSAAGGARLCAGQWGYDGSTPGEFAFYIVPDIGVIGGNGLVGQPIPLGTGGATTTAPDEVLRLTGIGFGDTAGSVRVQCRIPWDSWHEWCNHSGSNGALTVRTLWRIYGNADNWIVAEWDGANHRVRVRARTSGVDRTALVLHDGDLGAMRETVIDFAIGVDGDNLGIAASVGGETDTGTLTNGALLAVTLDEWQAGANESGAISAIEVFAVETFAAGGNASAMDDVLETMPGPGFPLAARINEEGWLEVSCENTDGNWTVDAIMAQAVILAGTLEQDGDAVTILSLRSTNAGEVTDTLTAEFSISPRGYRGVADYTFSCAADAFDDGVNGNSAAFDSAIQNDSLVSDSAPDGSGSATSSNTDTQPEQNNMLPPSFGTGFFG